MSNASATLERRPSILTGPIPNLAASIVTIPDTIAGMACPSCGCGLSACLSGCGCGCSGCGCGGTGHHAQSCTICFGTGWYYAAPDATLTRCPNNC